MARETFGSEAFWGDTLQLHKAIAGEKNGGVGPGVSPKAALSVARRSMTAVQIRFESRQIRRASTDSRKFYWLSLDLLKADPATTIALHKLSAVVAGYRLRQPRRQRQVDGYPVRILSLDRRQLIRAWNW